MHEKNGNNFSSFWIKTQGGYERSKEAVERLENLWLWDTGIPSAAFLFNPHGSTRFPCPWTDAMEDPTTLGFDMRDGRSGAPLMRRVMVWSPSPLLLLSPSLYVHVGADRRRKTSVFLWLPRHLSLRKGGGKENAIHQRRVFPYEPGFGTTLNVRNSNRTNQQLNIIDFFLLFRAGMGKSR